MQTPILRWRISLKEAHDQKGESANYVAGELGMSHNTVFRFVKDRVVYLEVLDAKTFGQLCHYYGVAAWDHATLVEYPEEDKAEDETETPLAQGSTLQLVG